jgi:hypothetical protein
MNRLNLLVGFLFILVKVTYSQADSGLLFEPSFSFTHSTPDFSATSKKTTQLRESTLTGFINKEVLSSDFVLSLDGIAVKAEVRKISTQNTSLLKNIETISGELFSIYDAPAKKTGHYSISFNKNDNNSLYGTFILATGKSYELTGNMHSAQLHTLSNKNTPPCAHDLPTLFPVETQKEVFFQPLTPSAGQSLAATIPDDASIIDVLVAYTSQARATAGTALDIENKIVTALELANTAYENSKIALRLRLVHTMELDGNESDNFQTDLDIITNNNDGHWDEVHLARDTSGADIVTLLNDSTEYCGLAWVLTDRLNSSGDTAFSVVSQHCITNHSFTHETAHNMGAMHDATNSNQGGIYTDSHGWRFTGESGEEWRTLMAYAPGSRINYFSNPLVMYDGVPTGSVDQADNASTLNMTRSLVAAFRSNVVIIPVPTPTSTPTISVEIPEMFPTVEPISDSTENTLSEREFKIRIRKQKNRFLISAVVYNRYGDKVTESEIGLERRNGPLTVKQLSKEGQTRFYVKKKGEYRMFVDSKDSGWFEVN